MRIGGLQKTSFIDFPGKIAAVVFTQGCNWRCSYCHNPSLVQTGNFRQTISMDDVLEFLDRRKDCLDGVVISGGEPTLQFGLPTFIDKTRRLGYAVKLDSNGSRPEVLQHLINTDRLDYVAMDLKAPLECYSETVGTPVDCCRITSSIRILQESDIEYELRTTIVPGLHNPEIIRQLLPLLNGCKRFRLQVFVGGNTLDPAFANCKPFPRDVIEQMADVFRHNIEDFKLIESPYDS